MGFLLQLVFVACYAGIIVVLTRSFGVGVAAMVYFLLVSVFTYCGGWLLRQSTVGEVSWKNRVAGFCLPWTGWVGGGTLRSLLVKNFFTGIIFGVVVLLFEQANQFQFHTNGSAEGTGGPPRVREWGLQISTGICWIILLGVWLWMLKTFLTRSSNVLSVLTRERGIWFLILSPPVAVAASITLRATGFPGWGLAVAAAPLVYVLLPVLLIIVVMLWHVVTGKPMRWN